MMSKPTEKQLTGLLLGRRYWSRTSKTLDLVGQRFGRLSVMNVEPRTGSGRAYLRCQCDCGNQIVVRSDGLRRGDNVSCGCKKVNQLTTHGLTKTPEHKVWCSMIERCHSPTHADFICYGGRGIAVCNEWRASFTTFLRDVGNRPTAQHSIDRIDNNDGYRPGNVRWATPAKQGRNSRTTKLTDVAVAEIRAVRGLISQSSLAAKFGVNRSTISLVQAGKNWRP